MKFKKLCVPLLIEPRILNPKGSRCGNISKQLNVKYSS